MQTCENEFFKSDAMPYIETWHIIHPEKHYKPHFHYMFSIGAIEDGEAEFIHNSHTIHLNTEELIVFNPETVHTCNLTKNSALTYHMICLDVTWCKVFQESMWNTKLDDFKKANRDIIKDKKMYKSFLELSALLQDQSVFHLEKEEALYEFLEIFFDKIILYDNRNNMHNTSVLHHIESSIKYLKQNIRKNITVAQLAKKASLSEYHFMRMFKQYMGMSPHAYLINHKINLAQQLLLNGTPIVEVALELGFVDQSHLNRHFQTIVAMSPGKFTRMASMNADLQSPIRPKSTPKR